MSDRLFSACCLGGEHPHAVWEPCPFASVDRSGEADETSTKIEGSAEGESAVPKGDAQ